MSGPPPVDLAMLLYLNPELVAYSNLNSLSAVASAWATQSNSLGALQSALPVTPEGFDPRVYLSAQPDVSGLNETIRLAMLGIGLSSKAVVRRGIHVSTLMEDVVLTTASNAAVSGSGSSSSNCCCHVGPSFLGFKLSALEENDIPPLTFSASNLRPGDHVRLQRQTLGDSVYGVVASVSPPHAFAVLPDSPAAFTSANVGGSEGARADSYTLAGIRIYDAERQALVAFSRNVALSNANASVEGSHAGWVDPDDLVLKPDFSLETYHSLYPDTKLMSLSDAYLDYRNRWRNNEEYRIIKGRDIFNLSAPYTSNLLTANVDGGSLNNMVVAGNITVAGGSLYVASNYVYVQSNLNVGDFLKVSRSNLTAGGNLITASACNGGTFSAAGPTVFASVAGLVRLGLPPSAGGASGMLVLTPGGDLVVGGAASNLAILQGPAPGLGGFASMLGGQLTVSRSNVNVANVLGVGDRVGIGMACVGDEGGAQEVDGWENNAGSDSDSDADAGTAPIVPTTRGTRLAVDGDIFATGTVITLSDARAKVGVSAIDGALGRVGRLRGYTYEMARQPEPEPRSRRPRGAGRKPLAVPVPRRHTGLLAQEVADVLPEAVFYRPRGDEAGRLAFAKRAPGGSADTADSADVDVAHIDADMDVGGPVASIAYGNLAGLFVGAINELRETVDRLAARVEALESKP